MHKYCQILFVHFHLNCEISIFRSHKIRILIFYETGPELVSLFLIHNLPLPKSYNLPNYPCSNHTHTHPTLSLSLATVIHFSKRATTLSISHSHYTHHISNFLSKDRSDKPNLSLYLCPLISLSIITSYLSLSHSFLV